MSEDGQGTGIHPILIEAKPIQKQRTRILPLLFVLCFSFYAFRSMLFVLYVVAYLDVINIGFAASAMNKELVITSQQRDSGAS
jgi:hypothetical protein